MKNKKAQIKMNETIAVLFIFFILVAFGMIFFYKYHQSTLEHKEQELLDEKTIDIMLKALYLPELVCTNGDVAAEDFCFDLLKVEESEKVFSKHLEDNYFEMFSFSKIQIQEIYPNNNHNWVIYDQPNLKEDSKGEYNPTRFIITLKNETKSKSGNDYALGYLEVGIYS